MAIVKYEKNGQGYYDFDALLNATSVEFVERVQGVISDIEERSYSGGLLAVHVDINESFSTVYVYEKSMVSVFSYYKSIQSIHVAHLSKSELEMMVGVLNG